MTQIEIVNRAILYVEMKIQEVKKQLRFHNHFDLHIKLAKLELELEELQDAY